MTGAAHRGDKGWPRLLALGDAAVSVEFGDRIDPVLSARVLALDAALRAEAPPGVVETVPTYRALTVHLDPLAVDLPALLAQLLRMAAATDGAAAAAGGRLWRVPVVYGGDFGADLTAIAAHCGMTPGAYAAAHAAGDYAVAMVGFLPGYSYLSGLDPRLGMPRRADPRLRTPAGSVAVGGVQTAVGSIEGPSGWHLIGRTPVRAFLADRDPPVLFAPGDRVRFVPVTPADWPALEARAAAGDPVAEGVG